MNKNIPPVASSSPTAATSTTEMHKGNLGRKSSSKRARTARRATSAQPKASTAPPSMRPSFANEKVGENWGVQEEEEGAENLTPKKIQRLPSNIKRFIVIQNACGMSPSEVVKATKEVFDFDVPLKRVECYDPTKAAGQALSMELKTLFRMMQREYQTMVVKAGVADQKWRLAKLHIIAQTAFDRGNYKLAMEAMEQAAKDAGGAYTNKSQIQIDDKRQLLAQLLRCDPKDLPAMKAAAEEAKDREKVH